MEGSEIKSLCTPQYHNLQILKNNTSNKSSSTILNTYKDTILTLAETSLLTETSGNNKSSPHNTKKFKNANNIKITKRARKEYIFNNISSENREMTNRNNARTRQIATTTLLISSISNNRLCSFSYSRNTLKVDSIWKKEKAIEKQSHIKLQTSTID